MATQDKKQVLKELLESGKQKGRLTTKEISDALEELDYDVEQVDKLYDTFEAYNIEIIEDDGGNAVPFYLTALIVAGGKLTESSQ